MLDAADDRPGDIVGGPPWRVAPGELCGAFEQVFEMFGLRRADGDDEDIDSQPREFRPHGFAETVDREFAGRVLAFMRAAASAQDRADVDDDRLHAFAQDAVSLRG